MDLNDNILSIINLTPDSYLGQIADRVRSRRLEQNLTQEILASKSGVSLASYRRFERTGEISFSSLLRIAFVLGVLADFDALFATKGYASLDELLGNKKSALRKRGGRNE